MSNSRRLCPALIISIRKSAWIGDNNFSLFVFLSRSFRRGNATSRFCGRQVPTEKVERQLANKSHKKFVTLTAIQLLGRFGALNIDNSNKVLSFQEKPKSDNAWINGGFFVLEPEIFDYIEGDEIMWEREPLEKLSKDSQVAAYKHTGFWKPMDTLRDKNELEQLWQSGQAPWFSCIKGTSE